MKTLTKEYVVTEQFSARQLGSGTLAVLATPGVIAFVEQTCLELSQEQLKVGETTVGTSVQLAHLKATKLGELVTVKVTLIERTKNILIYECEVFARDSLIAKGSHQRAIVDQARFLERLKQE